jgi:hypothetical protein
MIQCTKCGFGNELGRIFCHQCGAKLEIDQLKPPTRRGGRSGTTGGFGQLVWRVIQVALLALIVWGIVLLVQVPAVDAVKSTEIDFVSVSRKEATMQRMIDQRQEASVPLTEAEVNAFLDRLTFEKAEGKGIKGAPSKLQIDFGPNEVTVIVIGRVKAGPALEKEFSLSYTGVPAVENGRFVFRPVAAAIGALPIHPFVLENSDIIQRYFAQLFGNLSEERRLLDSLSTILVNRERAVLEYRPPASPTPQASN